MNGRGQILVDIDPEGNVTWEVRGVGGPRCRDLVKELEQALGGEIVVQPTAEMTAMAHTVNQVRA
jgi:hypothetical protein